MRFRAVESPVCVPFDEISVPTRRVVELEKHAYRSIHVAYVIAVNTRNEAARTDRLSLPVGELHEWLLTRYGSHIEVPFINRRLILASEGRNDALRDGYFVTIPRRNVNWDIFAVIIGEINAPSTANLRLWNSRLQICSYTITFG